MKKQLLILCVGLLTSMNSVFGQLPAVAQQLYDSAYANDPVRGQYSIDNGAVATATADGNSFYLQWFPAATPANSQPLLVTIHGTSGTAFDEFYLWHQYAAAKGVGIIALQWYKGYTNLPPDDYCTDLKIYEYIDTALTRIQYPSDRALFHGFSRGSAMSYAIAFRDVQAPNGKNYFCTIFSNAGKADSTYFLYNQINSGMYGHTFYTGKNWGMYCGGTDPDPEQNGCPGMNDAKIWVEANGANVGLFIADPVLGHGGFHQTPAYLDSCLNYYLTCYTAASISELENFRNPKIYPNPLSTQTTLEFDTPINNATLNVYNCFGEIVLQINNLNGNTIILNRNNLAAGIYFFQLTEENKIITTDKLIISD